MTHTRRRSLALASAVTVLVGSIAVPALPATAAEPAAGFFSSFETTDPAPDWTSTVEVDATGARKSAGITGSPVTGIPGNITDKVVAVAASGENAPNELAANVFDRNVNTKWLVFAATAWVQGRLSDPIAVVGYALTSANDAPERDPRDWTLQGSADGQTWTTIDTRSGQSFETRFQTKQYTVASPAAYVYYRLDVTATAGGSLIQLAELQLSNGDTTPPPPTDMRAFVTGGPVNGYNQKPNVGFTGLKSLQYSGGQIASHGYAYNKVFDVDLPVTDRTELSYRIFPELTANDLDYPSTYAAVDLAFTDGTYLSELGALDQHGVGLHPRAQGESRTFYADEWNHRQSRIGDVAAGKTIDRILVAYDSPTGVGLFNGWIDDIRITPSPEAAPQGRLSDHVLTTRGTNSSSGFSRGNNFPATAVPHGFNFWTPVTNAGSTSWLYEYHRQNNAQNLPQLQAFAASHEPSPWMGDRQTFQVMPTVSTATPPSADRAARALPFRHDNEIAKAHYYSVTFENGLRTEIAPADHAAVFRFTFPGNSPATLLFDNVSSAANLTVDAASGVATGYSDIRSGLSTGATRMYLYATFDQPITASGRPTGVGSRGAASGWARFAAGEVTMRIATSLIGVEQARHNLDLEVAGATFDQVRERAQQAWDSVLRVVEVEGATDDPLTTLYSDLYRLHLYPNSAFENTGTAEQPVFRHAVQSATATPASGPTQTGAPVKDGKVYVNNGFWDTYRTTWPAYSLLSPTLAGQMIDGFVQQYRDGGWTSRWSSPGYANLMVGTSSDVAFADAYRKGVRGFDAVAAYEAAVKNATVTPPNPNVGRKGLATSAFLGYTSVQSTGEAMSWAMDGYINDFGIAMMAEALYAQTGERRYLDDHEYFLNRAQNYVNMFDPAAKFFQGRNADGTWRVAAADYDPRVWGYDYTETDGWNMAFHVPQDGQGLANLYGGRAGLADKLDEFFATPETAGLPGSYGGLIHEMREARDVRMGQYGHSNQPSHHIIYMYDYAGQPWKAQRLVRDALSRLYLGSEIGQGYLGDEDNGEMSAWQIFGALGFYPLQMGSPTYAIGSPLFRKATIHLENGKDIVVNAPGNSARNVYVQGLQVNGQPYTKTYLPHDLLTRGAVLDFAMGAQPSKWGAAAEAAPPSITQGAQIPRPLRDTTGGPKDSMLASPARPSGTLPGDITRRVTAVTASGENPPAEVAANLVDGDSGTKWLVFTPTGWARLQLDEPAKVVTYALTSANDAPERDPQDWMLQGSDDGQTWTTLDTRTGEQFTDRFQTKTYTFDNDIAYRYYRLDVTRNAGASILQLADIRLGTGDTSGPVDLAGLCDNSTANRLVFAGATPWVQYEFGGDKPRELVTYYTLTSGATGGDPRDWALKGSYDGVHWAVIDQRAGEEFPWRLQTRAFPVASPGPYSFYRLEVKANTGGDTTEIAELELLAHPLPL